MLDNHSCANGSRKLAQPMVADGDKPLVARLLSHVPIVGHLNANYGNTSASQLWEHSRAPTRGTPRVAWASGTETKKI